jgi:hypothetical protein
MMLWYDETQDQFSISAVDVVAAAADQSLLLPNQQWIIDRSVGRTTDTSYVI